MLNPTEEKYKSTWFFYFENNNQKGLRRVKTY